MFGTHDLPLFIASGLLLNMAPGPDSLLIMARSASQGWRAGSAASLGICAGTFVHIFAAALGLSAVLATSATAFTVVKYVGAAYLLYIGLGMVLGKRQRAADADADSDEVFDAHADAPNSAPPQPQPQPQPVPLPYRRIFLQGFMTNALNPKVALFFLAFVPQFIAPESTSKALAFIALGCLFNITSLLWCHGLAVFTAFASQRLRVSGAVTRWLNRLIGAAFVAFGIKLALQDQT